MKAGIEGRAGWLWFVLFGMVALISGCGSEDTSSDKEGEVRVIQHAMGETKIQGTPKRVVVLTNEGTEAALALGVKPVGAVKSWIGNPWYDHIKEEMKGVKMVGDEVQPNIEMIAGLKPDLIIGTKVRQEKAYKQLSGIAPTVMSENLSGNWKKNMMLYAEAMNKKKEGEELLQEFDSQVNEVKEKLGDQRKKEISLVRFLPGQVRIYNKDTFAGVLLEQLGFARPESQDKKTFIEEVTKERIPDMDGDVLFYFTSARDGDVKATETEKDWMQDPLWKKMKVAKENEIYKVNEAIWNTAGGIKAARLLLEDIEKHFVSTKQDK